MKFPLRVFRVYRSAIAIFILNAKIVLPAAIVAVFVPAIIDVFVEHHVPKAVSGFITTALDNIATAIFAGAAEQLVHRWEEGERRIKLRGIVSRVPPVIGPLFLVAIAQGLLIALGFVLLIIPGFVALTFFAVVGPTVVAERTKIRATFKRSAQLVRGNAWRVFAIMFSLELLAAIIAFLVGLIFTSTGGSPENPISFAIGESVTLPLEVLAVATMYWRLREIEAARAAETDETEAESEAEAEPAQ